jgi:hypothetical protein
MEALMLTATICSTMAPDASHTSTQYGSLSLSFWNSAGAERVFRRAPHPRTFRFACKVTYAMVAHGRGKSLAG